MAKSRPAPKRKSSPGSKKGSAPSSQPQVAQASSVPAGPKKIVRVAAAVIIGALLWWKLGPNNSPSSSPAPSAAAVAPDPNAPPHPDQVFSLEFDGIKSKRGYTGWGDAPKQDLAIMGGPLVIKDQTYAKGIGTHAPSEIVFSLKGNVKRFSCLGGVDKMAGDVGKLTLVVKADGKKLFESKVLSVKSDPVAIDVNVAGAKELTLIVNPALADNGWDQADWVNLKFQKGGL